MSDDQLPDFLRDFADDDEAHDGDDDALRDFAGVVMVDRSDSELVLAWRPERENRAFEVLRYDLPTGLLRITPMVRRRSGYDNPFQKVTELQLDCSTFEPEAHSENGDREGLLHVVGLPRGFNAVYEYGLGVARPYRGLLEQLERHTDCTTVRFTSSETEGMDGDVFWITLQRFEEYRATVDRNQARARTAYTRVDAAEQHNAVADLFDLDLVQPKYTAHPIISAITEVVATGAVMNAEDRALLLGQAAAEAHTAATEAPEQFCRLREDIELVSLDVLVDQFERSLTGHSARDESHWQGFFALNPFALQQVFSAPILVLHGQAHVRGSDVLGGGSRIADFLCVNAVTRSAVVVEIKTPATKLMATKAYRGSGSAEVYPAHRDLSGAVSQVQAQMESVPRDLKHSPGLGSLDQWHVRGAVISGKVSELTDEQRASFLRYREGLTAVTVLGYDEVGARLKALQAMLTEKPNGPGSAPAAQ